MIVFEASEVEVIIIDPATISIQEKGLDLMDTSIPNDIMMAGWRRRQHACVWRRLQKRGITRSQVIVVHASFVKNGGKGGLLFLAKMKGDRPLNTSHRKKNTIARHSQRFMPSARTKDIGPSQQQASFLWMTEEHLW